MLVQDFLHGSAARYPNKTALVCAGQRLTYAEIDSMANRLANAMIAEGLTRGDRVVIYLSNSVEAVTSIMATLKAGGVFVVANPDTKLEKLVHIVNDCNATILVGDSRKALLIQKVLLQTPTVRCTVYCGKPAAPTGGSAEQSLDFALIQAAYPDARPPQTNIDLDLACLIYTSGTTGDAKGVMSDHSNVVFAVDSITAYLGNVPEDIVIDALPLSFDYGLYQLLMTFRFGGTLVLERSFAYPAQILCTIERERVTGFPCVPTMFAMLMQMDLTPYDLSSLRYLTNTAAALPAEHVAEIRAKFPTATLFLMYGLTETKRTLYLPPAQLDIRPSSVGIPIPGTEAWVEDEAGNRLGAGQVGELVVRGRHVMRGYWRAPVASAQRFRPGPLPGERVCYTGDRFRMDEEGYFYFVGRMDDIIKCRGEKVAPREVESVLYGLKGVVEAAVIGVPDPVLGEAIKAFIVSRDAQLSERAVLAHCRAHLEELKVPKFVEFRDELPKTESGKIKKTALQ